MASWAVDQTNAAKKQIVIKPMLNAVWSVYLKHANNKAKKYKQAIDKTCELAQAWESGQKHLQKWLIYIYLDEFLMDWVWKWYSFALMKTRLGCAICAWVLCLPHWLSRAPWWMIYCIASCKWILTTPGRLNICMLEHWEHTFPIQILRGRRWPIAQ